MTDEQRIREAVADSWDPKEGRRATRWIIAALLLVALITAGIALYVAEQTSQKDNAAGNARSLADQVRSACANPSTAADLGAACKQATSVAANPVAPVPGPPGPAGAPGVNGSNGRDGLTPSADQISAAVQQYLAANPAPAGAPGATGAVGPAGASATTDQVTAAVAVYLTQHPPAPGSPPSAQQISDAVNTYLQAHPPAAGPPGGTGPPGPTGAPGAPGAAGATGVGVASTKVKNCELFVTLTDGRVIDAGQVCGLPVK